MERPIVENFGGGLDWRPYSKNRWFELLSVQNRAADHPRRTICLKKFEDARDADANW
jgi:hypothetical protein